MRLAALFVLTLCTMVQAAPRKVIFRNVVSGEYRVLENGILSEPMTGIANGLNAKGDGPLGIVYHDDKEWRELTTSHGTSDPLHPAEVTELLAAIGEYNSSRLPFAEGVVPKGLPKERFVPSRLDPRTGLIVEKGGFDGFVFHYREGKWLGHTQKVPPNALVTRVAEATRQALYKLPKCRIPFTTI